MINETTILLNGSVIPIKVMTETNWTQYTIALIVGSLFLFIILSQYIYKGIAILTTKTTIRKLNKITGRHTIIIRHKNVGIFGGDMIDQETYHNIKESLEKANGKDINIILHTPGGHVFYAKLISKILRNYKGKIHCYITTYAMSGGTVLALSTNSLHMSQTATLGPVDPQLGGFFESGSAAGWNEVIKAKGKKAEDKTYLYNRLGKQVTESMKQLMEEILQPQTKQYKQLAKYLTIGKVEHIKEIDMHVLTQYGLVVQETTSQEQEVIDKTCRSDGRMETYI